MIQPENEDIVRASLYIQDNGINTVRKICNLESIVYNRQMASGLTELNKYTSKSEEKDLDLLDMNLGHVLRAFSSTIEENKQLKESIEGTQIGTAAYKRGWNSAYNQIRNALFDTPMK